MTDRELLEAAAKALGGEYRDHALGGQYLAFLPNWNGTRWNPLDDDGDALRLAVALRLDVSFNDAALCVYAGESMEPFTRTPDPAAATRRAIVMAAAQLGKA